MSNVTWLSVKRGTQSNNAVCPIESTALMWNHELYIHIELEITWYAESVQSYVLN